MAENFFTRMMRGGGREANAVGKLYEQKEGEDEERIQNAVQEQKTLFEQHDVISHIKEATRSGKRALDLKRLGTELADFYQKTLPRVNEQGATICRSGQSWLTERFSLADILWFSLKPDGSLTWKVNGDPKIDAGRRDEGSAE